MNISILGTNLNITQALREKVHNEFKKFKKVLDPSTHIAVEIGKVSNRHKKGNIFKAEAKIVEPKAEYFADFTTGNLYSSIAILSDELFEKITRSKSKHRALSKKGSQQIKQLLKFS